MPNINLMSGQRDYMIRANKKLRLSKFVLLASVSLCIVTALHAQNRLQTAEALLGLKDTHKTSSDRLRLEHSAISETLYKFKKLKSYMDQNQNILNSSRNSGPSPILIYVPEAEHLIKDNPNLKNDKRVRPVWAFLQAARAPDANWLLATESGVQTFDDLGENFSNYKVYNPRMLDAVINNLERQKAYFAGQLKQRNPNEILDDSEPFKEREPAIKLWGWKIGQAKPLETPLFPSPRLASHKLTYPLTMQDGKAVMAKAPDIRPGQGPQPS